MTRSEKSASRIATLVPLSASQRRMWLLEQSDPSSGFQNLAWALRLSGSVDVPALEACLNVLVGAHPALRTTFESVDGEPVQVVQSVQHRPLQVEQIVEEQYSERAAAFLSQPFRLDSDWPSRFRLYCLGPREYRLVLAF